MFRKGLIICAMAGMLTAGVSFARTQVYVGIAPPAPVIETPGPRPGAAYVWTPGYYRWSGGRYVWARGRWMMPPPHYHRYTAGHWVHARHGWYYRDGRWR
jgi:WXXGXW repeat (2 copies)